jgi:hypothetical protein
LAKFQLRFRGYVFWHRAYIGINLEEEPKGKKFNLYTKKF